MATFLDIVNNVMDATGRTDMESYIRRKVHTTIRWLASSGTFPQTHVEWVFDALEGIAVDSYRQSLTLPADFRKMNYVRYPEGVSTEAIKPLATTSLDMYKLASVQDRYYLSGSTLHIRNATLTPSIYIGYYAYPAPLADEESNWITDQAEDIIEELVNVQVLALIGERAASNSVARITAELINNFQRDRVQGYRSTSR